MKILIVSQYYRPDITAAAFRIAETAELLANRGHEVTVITAEPHRVQATQGWRDTSTPTVHRVPIESLSGGGMKAYLRHYFSFVFRARKRVRQLLKDGLAPDVIWASSPPLFVGLVGTAAARWSRAPLVLDVRDIWPATAVAAGQLSTEGRGYRLGRRLEHWLYRRVTHITCVAEPMAQYVRSELNALDGRHDSVSVVYNGAATGDTDASEADVKVHPRVLYAGNLGRLQGIDTLIDAWSVLTVEERNGWWLEIIGHGVLVEELQDQAATSGVSDSVVFRGVLSKEQTAAEAAQSAALFLNLLPNAVFDLTIPSKLFDYLATGRPIIGGISGEGRRLLESLPGNETPEPSNAQEIARAIANVIGRGVQQEPLEANIETVRSTFSRGQNTDRLETVFQTVAIPARET